MSLSEIVLREMGDRVALSQAQLESLEAHYSRLRSWNTRMNLTTVIDLPEAAIRHYCESLFLGSYLTAGRIVDVGSGPGFPGLVCAILRVDCEFTLVESHQRKAVFLKEAARALPNVKVRASRAEALTEAFDWVTARAVDPEAVMSLKLASRFALLMGEGDVNPAWNAEVVRMPWGARRVLVLRGA